MIRFLIHRPVSVFMVYIGLACLALISLLGLPVSLLPDIPIPEMRIVVEAEDKSAQEIEKTILAPIKNLLLQVDGVQEMDAVANQAFGLINLRFKYSENIDLAFIEVNEKIDQSLAFLPQSIDRPRVVKTSANELPAVFLSVSLKNETGNTDFFNLSQMAEQRIKRRLEQLESVALVDISGLSSQQISITPDKTFLLNRGIDQKTLEEALLAANFRLGVITIKERAYEYTLKLGEPISTMADIKSLPIKIGKQLYRLDDLATITWREGPRTGMYLSKNKRAIALGIVKNQSTSIKRFKADLSSVISYLNQEYPSLALELSQDQTYLLTYAIQNLRQSLMLSMLLATFFVFLFYRDWRTPIIIGVLLPLSTLLSILFFNLLGLSLNLISLSGLILGLGLMIDNGIIVLDNLSQLSLRSANREEACIKGTNEMIRPLLSSMLTTCAVFLPLLFLSDLSGALFYDQAVAICIGLGVSYATAITLLPTLYFVIPGQPKLKQAKNWLHHFYSNGYHLTFKFPVFIYLLVIITIALGICTALRLPTKRFPILPQKSFESYIHWNQNIPLEDAALYIQQIFEDLEEEVSYYNARIGTQQFLLNIDPNQQRHVVHLFVETSRIEQINRVKEKIQDRLAEIAPKAEIEFLSTRNFFELLFPSNQAQVVAHLYNQEALDNENYFQLEKEINQFLESNDQDLEVWLPKLEDQLLLSPNKNEIAYYDIDLTNLLQSLKQALYGVQVMRLDAYNFSVPIVFEPPFYSLQETLKDLKIENKQGQMIPMSKLVTLERIKGPQQITSSLKGTYLPLQLSDAPPAKWINLLGAYDQYKQDFSLDLGGSYFTNQFLLLELSFVLLVVIILLYFILAAQFESLLQPIILLMEIPISLSGGMMALYLTQSSINIMSLIGMIVATGIIINDSIIKVDTINRLKKKGLSTKEAIHEGGLRRLNPIVMTTMTSILAILPFFLTSDLGAILQQPLAIALIGSLFIGTFVSLFFIPLLYASFYRN